MNQERGDIVGSEVFTNVFYDYTLIASSDNTVLFKMDLPKMKEYKPIVEKSISEIINSFNEIHKNTTENLVKVLKNTKIEYKVKSVTVRDNPFDKREKEEKKVKEVDNLIFELQAERRKIKPEVKNLNYKIDHISNRVTTQKSWSLPKKVLPKGNEETEAKNIIQNPKIKDDLTNRASSLTHKISVILEDQEKKLPRLLSIFSPENKHQVDEELVINEDVSEGTDKTEKQTTSKKNSGKMNLECLNIEDNILKTGSVYITEGGKRLESKPNIDDKSEKLKNQLRETRKENKDKIKIVGKRNSCSDFEHLNLNSHDLSSKCSEKTKFSDACNEIEKIVSDNDIKDIISPYKKTLNSWKRALSSKKYNYQSGDYDMPLLSQLEKTNTNTFKITRVKLRGMNQNFIINAK